jgi:hypothetical protein
VLHALVCHTRRGVFDGGEVVVSQDQLSSERVYDDARELRVVNYDVVQRLELLYRRAVFAVFPLLKFGACRKRGDE